MAFFTAASPVFLILFPWIFLFEHFNSSSDVDFYLKGSGLDIIYQKMTASIGATTFPASVRIS